MLGVVLALFGVLLLLVLFGVVLLGTIGLVVPDDEGLCTGLGE